MQAAPSPPQTRPLRGEKFRFPSSPIPCFHALPLQALLSPLFLFLPFFCPPTLSCVVGLIFSHPILPPPLDSSTTGSHAFNRACLGLRWCRSPTRLSKPHTGSHRCEFGFFLQNEFTLPLKGEELGIVCLVRRSFHAEKPGAFPQEKRDASYPRASLAVAFGNCWPQLAHTASTGPVWGFAGVAPLLGPQKRTQGHTGASLVFACLLAHLRRITIPFGNPV